MKNLLGVLFAVLLLCGGCSSDSAKEEEPEEDVQVTLFDKEKEAIAYIDNDDDATIYTFDGEPLAYIVSEEWVYGFNGKLLGWYSEGVLYDRSYYAVGARSGIVRGGINTTVTHLGKLKSNKQLKPVKHVPEASLAHPLLKDSWSETSLTDFLNKGRK